jgi:hypothetical protein
MSNVSNATEFAGRTVFIPQDFMLVDVFNDIAGRLQARGVDAATGVALGAFVHQSEQHATGQC